MRALVIAAAALVLAPAPARSGSTSFAFGRIGGNIVPFTIMISPAGAIAVEGSAHPAKTMVGPAGLAGLRAAVIAQRFFTLPKTTTCPSTLPDFASQFVTVNQGGVSRRVAVRGNCSRRFSALYAALAGAVGLS